MWMGVYPQKETTVLTAQEEEWVLGPVWTGVEKRKCLATTGVQTLNRPACNVVAMPSTTNAAPLTLHYRTEKAGKVHVT